MLRPLNLLVVLTMINGCTAADDVLPSSNTNDAGAPHQAPLGSPPTDVSDPWFLPMGDYDASIIAASCDDRLQPFGSSSPFVTRRGRGMNIALPLHFGRPGSEGTFPRQDVTLDEPVRRWVAKDEVRCPGGEIETSLTITELTPIRIVLGFREDRQDCGAGVDPVCTIDFAYSLVRPACLPPEDPACARNIRFELASGLWQPVECTCQR